MLAQAVPVPPNLEMDKGCLVLMVGALQPRQGLTVCLGVRVQARDSESRHMVVNSANGDLSPLITSDRETLYFNSDRPGGLGGQDLYVTTRTREKR